MHVLLFSYTCIFFFEKRLFFQLLYSYPNTPQSKELESLKAVFITIQQSTATLFQDQMCAHVFLRPTLGLARRKSVIINDSSIKNFLEDAASRHVSLWVSFCPMNSVILVLVLPNFYGVQDDENGIAEDLAHVLKFMYPSVGMLNLFFF